MELQPVSLLAGTRSIVHDVESGKMRLMCKKVKRKSVEVWGKQEEVDGKNKTRGMIERAKKNIHHQCNI